jgi:RND family efflux transporter MFP subunit
MKIYADVSETYLSDVHKGDVVEVEFPDLENRKYSLTVFRKENVINNKTRTFKIEMKIDNPRWELKPNLFTLVRFRDYYNPATLVVPSEIIKKDLKGYFLYVLKEKEGNNIARKVYISPGIFYQDKTQVKEGLVAGDRVIVDGYDQVTNGEIVKLIR